jgi:hypothetical protein
LVVHPTKTERSFGLSSKKDESPAPPALSAEQQKAQAVIESLTAKIHVNMPAYLALPKKASATPSSSEDDMDTSTPPTDNSSWRAVFPHADAGSTRSSFESRMETSHHNDDTPPAVQGGTSPKTKPRKP